MKHRAMEKDLLEELIPMMCRRGIRNLFVLYVQSMMKVVGNRLARVRDWGWAKNKEDIWKSPGAISNAW